MAKHLQRLALSAFKLASAFNTQLANGTAIILFSGQPLMRLWRTL
jgi:hypothetical protein